MPVISARNLSKSYGPQTLFERISFTVKSRERVGLLGVNGTGKSTLLRILAGLEVADEGTLERRRGARVQYLAQEPTLDPEATPRQIVERGLAEWHAAKSRHEQISAELAAGAASDQLLEEQAELTDLIEHLGGWTREHVALEMLQHLGVQEIDRPVGTMSGGERRRVALAELLVSAPSLAILDEPTNHLDTQTIEWLEQYLADQFPGAVLMVTHDRYVLDAIADRVLELDGGKLTEFEGGYAEYLDQKAELMAHAERAEQNRLNLLRRERAWLLRGAKARTTKQKARIKRAETLLGTAAPKAAAKASFAGLEQGASRTGKTILDLENVAVAIDDKTLIRSLTLRLVLGDRVGIVGANGTGKTSLLRVVAGEREATSGAVVRGQNTRIVYFDQTRSNLRDDWSVFDNVAEREGALRSGAAVVQIGERTLELRSYLEQFLFDPGKQRQNVGALSGGERARVALAKALKNGPNLLLLDEPTNDLDVATLGALEELLETWPGCALIVSHDRYFLDKVATSILAFEGDGKVTLYPGNYSTYRSLAEQAQLAARAQSAAAVGAPVARAEGRSEAPPNPEQKPLSMAERRELDGILDVIGALEAAVGELQARLGDPALYAGDPDVVKRTRTELEQKEQALLRATERWEELERRSVFKKR